MHSTANRDHRSRPSVCHSLKARSRASVGRRKNERDISYFILPDNKCFEFRRSKRQCDTVLEDPMRLAFLATTSARFGFLLQNAPQKRDIGFYSTDFLKSWHGRTYKRQSE